MIKNLIKKKLNRFHNDVVTTKLCISPPLACKMQIFFIYNIKSLLVDIKKSTWICGPRPILNVQNQVVREYFINERANAHCSARKFSMSDFRSWKPSLEEKVSIHYAHTKIKVWPSVCMIWFWVVCVIWSTCYCSCDYFTM